MIDKSKIKKAFSRSATTYDRYGTLQRDVAKSLSSLISQNIDMLDRILDIGTGTGNVAIDLADRYPSSDIHACDIAHGMSVYAERKFKRSAGKIGNESSNLYILTAEAEFLPYPSDYFDLVVSSLTYQWVYDLRSAFFEVRRVLKEAGWFFFTMLGQGTLKELRDSYISAWDELGDKDKGRRRLHRFVDINDVECMLKGIGFGDMIISSKRERCFYQDVVTLLHTLKFIGAQNASVDDGESGINGRMIIDRMIKIYEDRYKRENGIPATYEVFFVRGKKGL
ncbi:MAG: methyltransferase domain-containing protein [Nitrospinae bacterium]|nr:methyltransferase domain-containing protein [Nitrospinota bacterium]